MDLHPDCEQLAFLLGVWRGAGQGSYPTIESFEYTEEVTFSHVGKPFLAYSQKTKDKTTGMPLHAETGYLRAVGGDRIEFVVVQPSGIVELHHGSVEGLALGLQLDGVHTTPGAKSVTDVLREIRVVQADDETTLHYRVAMAAVGEPLTHHLQATLVRQPSD